MRVLHVVSLISPDGAYGGPVRVAVNQATALRELGHDVTIAASVRGYDVVPTEQDGVPLELFPVRTAVPGIGYAGITSPGLLRWLGKSVSTFDIVHIHLARDLLTLPAAWIAKRRGIPFAVQPHGMIDASGKLAARPLDALLTRPVLRSAGAVFCLTDREMHRLTTLVGAPTTMRLLANGVPALDEPLRPQTPPDVLYLARLHERKRPTLFVEAARTLLDEGVDAQFSLVGPDEGQGGSVGSLIDGINRPAELRWEGALAPSRTAERMSRASIYVLPALDEPFGMTILEAMALGLPVVITDRCGLAAFVSSCAGGLVIDPRPTSLVDAVRTLIQDPTLAAEMGQRGRSAVRDRFGMDSIAGELAATYHQLIGAA